MKKIITAMSLIIINIICITLWSNSNFEILQKDSSQTNIHTDLLEISSYIYNISLQQIQIWNKFETNKWYNSETNPEVLEILAKLKYYAWIDIITLLDISRDKPKTLQDFLSQANHTIETSDYFRNNLELEINDNISQLENCSKQKSLSDKSYFQALEKEDLTTMDISINQSKESDKCISTNRIESNSKQAILDKMTFLTNTLAEKYDFLYKKQDIIIANFETIKANISQELSQITDILKQYQIE